MQKTCKKCSKKIEITNSDLEFYKKVSPKFDGKVFEIPSPTLCPECRQQRRLAFRNERKLYKRKCDATGENIISIYSPDKKYKIFEQNFWWSDKWNPLDYGKDFDFSKSFFEQFKELQLEVPRVSVINGMNENSYYCNHAAKQKDCYFSSDALENEKCYYTNDIYYSTNCIDSSTIKHCENITNSAVIIKSFNCHNCFNLQNCNNCYLSNNLINCANCIWCSDIVNWEYFVLNKKVSKEDFKKTLDLYKNDFNFKKEFIEKFDILNKNTPKRNLNNINSTNSLWNYLSDVENVNYSYNIQNSKNLKYCTYVYSWEDCYDYDVWWDNVSKIYETHCAWWIWAWASNILFSNIIWGGSNIFYSDNLVNNADNCFWCISLKNNESYCILNKQYTKEEYNKLIPKIIEHMQKTWEWWEFFPENFSHYWYNETIAQDYFPLEKEKALELGFNWSDFEAENPKVEKIIPASKLPEKIADIPDDILNWAIKCEVTNKPFRIISQELEFYRKHNLPIPKKHPDQRYLERLKLKNPRKLFDRKCDKCWAHIKSTYSPNREEIVYCEKCYNKEIY